VSESHITFRKVIVGAGSGLAGAIVGGAIVKFVAPKFAGSPPWLFPAIVVGILAAPVVSALTVPTIISDRRRSKHKATASR
jgi:hypothetical protein